MIGINTTHTSSTRSREGGSQFQDPHTKTAMSVSAMKSLKNIDRTRAPRLRQALTLVAVLTLALAGAVHAADSLERLSGVVNLNTADAEQLQLLPGVGQKRAEAIINIRRSKGGFKAIEELVEVKGVGSAMLERLRPHLTLSGKTTAKYL